MGQNKKAKCLLDSALEGENCLNFKEKVVVSGGNQINNKAVLFSRGRRTDNFFTEESGLYLSAHQRELAQRGVSLNRPAGRFDGLSARIVNDYMKYRPTKKKDRLVKFYIDKISALSEEAQEVRFQASSFWRSLSPTKALNISMIGAVLVGMISMSLIYRYLGPGASADNKKTVAKIQQEVIVDQKNSYPQTRVLGVEDEKEMIKEGIYFESILNDLVENKKEESEQKIREMVAGYPIEEMVPYIAEKDPIVAAFLVSIARKESLWGKRVPVLNGQDCYNYWGYRGVRKLMGTGGHTCFNSRKDAVDTVAKRIEFLVSNKKLDTPAKMVIWKCGSDCEAAGGQAAANKWIADVNYYFKKLNDV